MAVVDSGVNPSVPGLVTGYNAADGSTDTREAGGHGTGVAYVVAATCGGCRIMPVRIADESGSSTQGTIAAGIRWASEHGARVINLSWGLAVGGRSTGQVERAIPGAVDRGATVTLAAMNDGSRDPNLNPWASRSPDAVRVGATDNDGRLQPSSNHGVWVDIGARGRRHVGRGAPRGGRGGGRARGAPEADRARGSRRRCAAAARRHPGARRRLALPARRRRRGEGRRLAGAVYRLAVSKAGRGAGVVGGSGAAIQCGEFCADRLDAGTVVTLTAAPMRGSRFAGWRGACRGTRPFCTIRLTGPTSAIAVFARRYAP